MKRNHNKPRLFVLQAFVFGQWNDIDYFRKIEYAKLTLKNYEAEKQFKVRLKEYTEK